MKFAQVNNLKWWLEMFSHNDRLDKDRFTYLNDIQQRNQQRNKLLHIIILIIHIRWHYYD